MATGNPYTSPQAASAASTPSPKLLLWSIVAVFGTAFVGGVLGLSIGAALGTFMPDYYRSIFSGGDAPHFNPLAVGMGQGLTQGVVFGSVIGLVLVFMFYRHMARKQANSV
jgi:hypothetical protein